MPVACYYTQARGGCGALTHTMLVPLSKETREMRRDLFAVITATLLTIGLAAHPAAGDVKLPAVFGDHMVLQRVRPCPSGAGRRPQRR